jgi:molecular chaperone DnaK
VPAVQAALDRSRFGKDAIQKAEGVVARARQAIQGKDVRALTAEEEQLDRTLQLFKGLAGAAGSRPTAMSGR